MELSDATLEAYLRQRAFDDFDAELKIDETTETGWRARCLVYDKRGEVELFGSEGGNSRREIMEALASHFAMKDIEDSKS